MKGGPPSERAPLVPQVTPPGSYGFAALIAAAAYLELFVWKEDPPGADQCGVDRRPLTQNSGPLEQRRGREAERGREKERETEGREILGLWFSQAARIQRNSADACLRDSGSHIAGKDSDREPGNFGDPLGLGNYDEARCVSRRIALHRAASRCIA